MRWSPKHLALISPILFLTLTSFGKGPVSIQPDFVITSCGCHGPFSATDGAEKVTIIYEYNASKSYTSNVIFERLVTTSTTSSEPIASSTSTSKHALKTGNSYTANLYFYPSVFADSDTVSLTFYVMRYTDSDNYVALFTRTCYLKVKQTGPYDSADYSDGIISFPNTGFDFTKIDNVVTEKYYFSYMSTYFLNDNYYELSLDNMYIKYEYPIDFECESAYLSFLDPNELFPYMSEDIPGSGNYAKLAIIKIPLNVTYSSSGKITFSFPTNYVNEATLEMSTTYRAGFTKTTHFYLPLNHADEFDGTTFTLTIVPKSGNGSLITHKMTYYAGPNLFGDCSNSDYCINGGTNP